MAYDLSRAVQGMGAISEMSLIFYRAAIKAGASEKEAESLTRAYLSPLLATGYNLRGQAPGAKQG